MTEKEFCERYGVAPIRLIESDASFYADFASVDHSFELKRSRGAATSPVKLV